MQQQGNNLIYHVIAFLTVVVWGSTFISTKVLINNGLSPAQIFTFRFLIAYILMLFVSHKRLFADNLKDELIMLALGASGGSVYFLTENCALLYSTTTNVSLIVCSCPLFATFLFCLFYKNIRLTRRQWAGAFIAFLGMIAVVLNGQFVLNLSPLGDSLAFGACLCWAVYSILMKPVTGRYGSAFITRKVFFYGLLTILPYYFFFPELPGMQIFANPVVFCNILFLGCIASMVCFLTWTWCIRKLGAMQVTNYVYVNPITTIIFGAWILDEHITVWFILGTALILLGLYLSNYHANRNEAEKPTV
ncbi:MAG: DMT family transporter [Prevotellaceae bacterium]|nr:DMT family transporter [Prevotellaceae bacterium]